MTSSAVSILLTIFILGFGAAAGGIAVAVNGRTGMLRAVAFSWGCVLGPIGWLVVAWYRHRHRVRPLEPMPF